MASSGEDTRVSNIALMNEVHGFDVVVVCTGDAEQATYWMGRLEEAKGAVLHKEALVLAVNEDWPGGAGNALGTFYAWKKACALAASKYDTDLPSRLASSDISVGLYHTAGKGTRLAPFPGSENNNKPGVKLPITLTNDEGKEIPLTILEAVVKQTGTYGPGRKGRLSVFWGDQVFIPSVPIAYTPTHHADILCTLGPMPNAETWAAKGMDKYGLIAVNGDDDAAQVEKVSHETASRLLQGLGTIKECGASLGSFSVSHTLLSAFMEEFAVELEAKEGKLDTDPHLWMPLTLSEEAYIDMMKQKQVDPVEAAAHYSRMRCMLDKFQSREGASALKLFGAVNVGSDAYWWDYGQLRLFQKNNLLAAEDSQEAAMLRTFLGLSPSNRQKASQLADGVEVDGSSVVCSCAVTGEGKVGKSVLSNVRCASVEAEGAILINVTAKKVVAPKGCIIYNVVDTSEEGLVLSAGEVLVGIFSTSGEQQLMRSAEDVDGGKVWKEAVKGNPRTFEQVYMANHGVSVVDVYKARQEAADKAWGQLSSSS